MCNTFPLNNQRTTINGYKCHGWRKTILGIKKLVKEKSLSHFLSLLIKRLNAIWEAVIPTVTVSYRHACLIHSLHKDTQL